MFGIGSFGIQELLIIITVITVLSALGLWPRVIRGIRELRGEQVADPGGADDIDLCFKMLGISPSAPWDEVEKAYRGKAKLHHPDRGGDDDTMRALNDAYSRIKSARNR
jgi:DnaJ-like protein